MLVEPRACQPLPARAMQRLVLERLSSNHRLKYWDRDVGGREAEGIGIKIAHAAR